jgi:iron complex transport system substrate-binding protein
VYSYRRSLPLLLLPLLLLLAACSGKSSASSASPASGQAPLRIQQSDGQALVLQAVPSRIVSLSPGATEIICSIGGGDRLVAVDKFANCPAGSRAKPEVDSFQPSLEAIAAFKPDLVYVFSDQNGIVAALRRLSLPVLFRKSPDDIDGVFADIDLLGRITGHEQEARALVDRLKQQRDAITAKLAGVSKGPRFYHELSNDYYSVRNDTFIGGLYVLLKADNIAAGASTQYPQLSAEAIVARDPEVIVLADGEKPADVRARPGWSGVSAVKNNRICEVDPGLVSEPGPHIIDALQALARCLYPERFP